MAQVTYITTDPESGIELKAGKRYLADFDISSLSETFKLSISMSQVINRFETECYIAGHPVSDVKIEIPAKDIIRIYFRPTGMPVILLVALSIGIILIGAGAAYGLGGGLFVVFRGIAEVPNQIAEVLKEMLDKPAIIIDKVAENPVPIIAIVIAVGVFIFGVGIRK